MVIPVFIPNTPCHQIKVMIGFHDMIGLGSWVKYSIKCQHEAI